MSQRHSILVLGTSTEKKLFKDRVERAVSLFSKGNVDKIIFSGKWWGGLTTEPESTESSLMSKYAISLGLPKKSIIKEERSLNTMGNFYFTKKNILEPKNIRELIVIAHKEHMPKVKFLAKKILGPNYKIKFTTDGKDLNSGISNKGVGDIKKFFINIKDGEDHKVKALLQNHPYYSKYKKF